MPTRPRHVLLGILGNRGFFPKDFAVEGAAATARRVREVLGDAVEYVDLGPVETWPDAKAAAARARTYRQDGDGNGCVGVIVSMYNFSDENGIRDVLRLADLEVPVLIHTEPDVRGRGRMGETGRRDGACGRFSVANALRHLGLPYTLTTRHCEAIDSPLFADDLRAFYATGVLATTFRPRGRGARVGLIGAPPDAFQTMTAVSSELLGHLGVTTVGLDLLALDREMRAVTAADVGERQAAIAAYLPAGALPAEALAAIARLGVVLDRFIAAHDLDGVAIRCWTEMQRYRVGAGAGIVPCACMSMLSERGLPAACETDLAGWTGMYLLQRASGLIPGLADWNNQFADRDDEIDLFHCGPWARCLLRPGARLAEQQIIATDPAVGRGNTWGTVDGDLIAGTGAFLRPCTDARAGRILLYGGVGTIDAEPVATFGTKGRLRIPRLQAFFRHVTAFERAVEHHTAFVVGDRRRIAIAMQAVRDAVPYFNHRAGRNTSGTELIEYYEHSTVAELGG
jgi:L-fucose isomerase-like protein